MKESLALMIDDLARKQGIHEPIEGLRSYLLTHAPLNLTDRMGRPTATWIKAVRAYLLKLDDVRAWNRTVKN